jgi:hypothetical protein
VTVKFRILVVEDAPEKGEIVREGIKSRIPGVELHIEIETTLVGALKRLERHILT